MLSRIGVPIMNSRDRINKASFDMMTGIKDSVTSSILNAINRGEIEIEQEHIQALFILINGTIETTYHNGNNAFMRCVDIAISQLKNEVKK